MSIDWIFGEYKILKKIASGGMAEVFLAKRVGVKGFEKLLAIKKILPQLSENEEFITMFIDEARLAARLNHRNIVQIYDFGNEQDSYYIAMEYIVGKDLRSILKKSRDQQQRLPLTQCAYIITESAKGLEYAHNLKDHFGNPLHVIHRDISPQNILVSYEGEVMLADFGIAKAASKSTETRAGVLKGKILYMSPEQAWGKPIDKRSDLYSLGVILYEMVADRKIFDADSEFSMLEKVRNAEVEFPPEIFEKIPKGLFYIIKRALKKNPENRYQSAHEMRVDLENYLLSTQETLSEKTISNYLNHLFIQEIEEERKILTETIESPGEKTIPAEPLPKTQIQQEVQEVEKEDKRNLLISFKEAFQKNDFRMKIGTLLVLLVLGGVIVFYLFLQETSTTTPSTEVKLATPPSSTPPPSPEVKIDLPKEKPVEKSAKPEEKPSPSPPLSPPRPQTQPQPISPEKPATIPEPRQDIEAEPKKPEKQKLTSLSSLLKQGPHLLQENKYIKLLEDIYNLSEEERQNINIRVLESFGLLKKWVLLKDKHAKVLWSQLYNTIENSGDRSATPLLIEITKDPEEWTRLYAVSLLGSIGDRRALDDLRQIAASDPNRKIRRGANKAISLIQSRG